DRTVQIGRPVDEVFRAWSDLEALPDHVSMIKRVRSFGRRSHWTVAINGRPFEWDAELIQGVPNRALGWKSVNGPKHTGRINFAPLGNDTLVHVQMNYAPPLGAFGRAVLETFDKVDQYVEQAPRDFKSSLEGKGQERATGTFGGGSVSGSSASSVAGPNAARPVDAGVSMPPSGSGRQTSRFGNQEETVDYTRPPEAK